MRPDAKTSQQSSILELMPANLYSHFLLFLTPHELCQLSLTCKWAQEKGDDQGYWRQLYQQDFPHLYHNEDRSEIKRAASDEKINYKKKYQQSEQLEYKKLDNRQITLMRAVKRGRVGDLEDAQLTRDEIYSIIDSSEVYLSIWAARTKQQPILDYCFYHLWLPFYTDDALQIADIQKVDERGRTLLFHAIHLQLDIKKVDEVGRTLLFHAIALNQVELFSSLVSFGAKLSAVDSIGRTLLHVAARFNAASSVVQTLIANNANVNAVDNSGETPLYCAARSNALEVVRELITRGTNVNAVNNNRWTPLHFAADSNALEVVKELIAKNADVNALTNDKETPLHFAVCDSNQEKVKLLLSEGANAFAQNSNGDDAFDIARHDNPRITSLLQEITYLKPQSFFNDYQRLTQKRNAPPNPDHHPKRYKR